MSDFTFAENMKAFGVKQAISYIDKDPEKNVPKLLDWLIKSDKNGVVSNRFQGHQGCVSDGTNWRRLIPEFMDRH